MKRQSKTKSSVKLPKKIKTLWVNALRSGKFKQAPDYLYNPDKDGYCCLGVLCKLQGLSNDSLSYSEFPESLTPDLTSQLHPFLLQSRGFNSKWSDDSIIQKLADMNDDGWTFKQIAAYIERYL